MSAKHIQDLKDVLGLDTFQKKREKKARKRSRRKEQNKLNGDKVIQTLATTINHRKEVPEIVSFSAHRSKKKKEVEDPDGQQDAQDAVTMDQARFDVFKFGLNALSKKERVEAKIALAIKLGAEPPKNECVPLEVLKQRRKKEKAEEVEMAEENESKLLRKPRAATNKAKGVSKKKARRPDNQMNVGSFNGGILRISSAELKKMKSKK